MPKIPQAPARVLLVDDNRHGNIARKNVLEQHGFEVDYVLSGEEALERFALGQYDVVVTDLKMSGLTGLDVIERIRESGRPTSIILLSGFAGCMGLTEESTGADAVLCKSNKEEELLGRTIRQLLARQMRKKASSQRRGGGSMARSG